MNIEKTYTPDIFGPGLWYAIHTLAADVKDDPVKWKFFEYFMRLMQDTMKCQKCKTHFGNYLNTNSFEKYKRMKNGAYIYTNIFHNAVNERLGKSQVDLQESFTYFSAKNLTQEQEKNCSSCNISNEPKTRIYEEPIPNNNISNIISAFGNVNVNKVSVNTSPINIYKSHPK